MFPADILAMAEDVLDQARARGLKIATAESCTGGLIAGALTAIGGSSAVVDRGFVTYSNEAKAELLGVDPALITTHGAVSEEVAQAMAIGALTHSRADMSVSVTGVAGPGGGTARKPVGLVWFGAAYAVERDLGSAFVITEEFRFGDIGRDGVREASVRQALRLLRDLPGRP
jgi:nicotinamide-nucleotide amidase